MARKMSNAEFRRRCEALGITGPGELADTLGLSRSGAWRVWTGVRGVSARNARRLMFAEDEMRHGALTRDERRLLLSATYPGATVEPPPARSNFDAMIDWPAIIARLRQRGLVSIHKRDKTVRITEAGIEAMRFYDGREPRRRRTRR